MISSEPSIGCARRTEARSFARTYASRIARRFRVARGQAFAALDAFCNDDCEPRAGRCVANKLHAASDWAELTPQTEKGQAQRNDEVGDKQERSARYDPQSNFNNSRVTNPKRAAPPRHELFHGHLTKSSSSETLAKLAGVGRQDTVGSNVTVGHDRRQPYLGAPRV